MGRVPGIYKTWIECKEQTDQFCNSQFKLFTTESEAIAWLDNKNKSFNFGRHREEKLSKDPGDVQLRTPKTLQLSSLQPTKVENTQLYDTNKVYIFTDGSCTHSGSRSQAGIGVYFGPNDQRNISERHCTSAPTNNKAEFEAIARAIDIAKDIKSQIVICTDSEYCLNCITNWHTKWQQMNWMKSCGQQVKNKHYIQSILQKLRGTQHISFMKIKAHTNGKDFFSLGNKFADKLAGNYASKQSAHTVQFTSKSIKKQLSKSVKLGTVPKFATVVSQKSN